MRGQLRIDAMFACIVLDDDGTEGIPAVLAPDGMIIPLVGADMTRLAQIRAMVLSDPVLLGKRIEIVKFSQRERLEMIQR